MAGVISRSSQTENVFYEYSPYLGNTSYGKLSGKESGKTFKENNQNNNDKRFFKKAGWFALKTAGISAGILGGIAIAVPVLGFGAVGVTAGSIAAAYQSAALGGTIASGSTFAVLQSIGAAGLAISTKLGIIGGSAAVAAVHTSYKVSNEIQGSNKLVEIKVRGENKRSVTTQTHLTRKPKL